MWGKGMWSSRALPHPILSQTKSTLHVLFIHASSKIYSKKFLSMENKNTAATPRENSGPPKRKRVTG